MIIAMVLIMSIIVYFVIQNNKIQGLFNKLMKIDHELEDKLEWYTNNSEPVDIYKIQEIRSMMTRDYIHDHRLDAFKIYKESMYSIKLILKLGIVVQVLEWRTNENQVTLRELPILKSDLELLGQ